MEIKTVRHGRITEATVTAEFFDQVRMEGVVGRGTAFRSKNDVRLDEIGETIAIGRAIQDFGRQVEARGHAQCVTKDEYARVQALIDKRTAARIASGVAESAVTGRQWTGMVRPR
jgi:hypothetical protein